MDIFKINSASFIQYIRGRLPSKNLQFTSSKSIGAFLRDVRAIEIC